jgi:isocitrate lyase
MDTRDFYVCLDARPSNISLLRRLANDHLRTADIAWSTAQKTQTTVVRAFAEAVKRCYPNEKVQIEVGIHHDPDPSVAVCERK